MFRIKTSLLSLLLLSLTACATALPPQELVDARKAYERASKSMAPQLAPAELDTAKQSLDKAEKSFEEEGPEEPTTGFWWPPFRDLDNSTRPSVNYLPSRLPLP